MSDNNKSGRYFGASVPRREDGPLLRGRGTFIDDIEEPKGTLFLTFLRSPHSHAKILAIDKKEAEKLPGVVAVFTGEQIAQWIRPISTPTVPGRPDIDRPMIATDVVRYAGEAVAVIVAESSYIAEDAIDLIHVDYDLLPAIVSINDALAPEAVWVHEGVTDNILYRGKAATEGTEEVFRKAAHILSDSFSSARVAAVPMETRGFLAIFDKRGGLTFYSPNQKPHQLRSHLAAVLGLAEMKVRVVAPDVGGAFGMKMYTYPEDVVGAALACQLSRPIKWIQDRQDDLLTSTHARDYRFDIELAVSDDGLIQGLRANIFVNVGAYSSSPSGHGVDTGGAAQFMIGPYRIKHYAYDARSVTTHTTPTGVYRGVAGPICAFALESLMDRAARKLGIDPIEFRKRNVLTPADLPYTNAVGVVCDTASHTECIDRALKMSNYVDFKRTKSGKPDSKGRLLGIGLACIAEHTGQGSARQRQRATGTSAIRTTLQQPGYVVPKGSPGYDSAAIRMELDGKVICYVSHATQGQGHVTVFAQLAAEQLGVSIDNVLVEEGDTSLSPYGTGTVASRGAVSGGGAVILASQRIAQKLRRLAAYALKTSAEDIMLADDKAYSSANPGLSIDIAKLATLAYSLSADPLPQGEQFGLQATEYYDPPSAQYSNAVHIACVAVDEASGLVSIEKYFVVHDCGRVINPMIVAGQVHGGVAQGLGEALMESMEYSREGQPLTTTLLDYIIPTAVDVPDIEMDNIETPSTTSVGGIKGAGEGGTIGAVPAITLAVEDALSRYNATVTHIPLTPNAVFCLMRAGSSG